VPLQEVPDARPVLRNCVEFRRRARALAMIGNPRFRRMVSNPRTSDAGASITDAMIKNGTVPVPQGRPPIPKAVQIAP
jgi:hypothetical protein